MDKIDFRQIDQIKKIINILDKNCSTKHKKRNKTVPVKVATTCTEDGHKQTTKRGYNMYRGWTQTDY